MTARSRFAMRLVPAAAALVALGGPLAVAAETTDTTTARRSDRTTASRPADGTVREQRLDQLKAVGAAEITRRLTTLQGLATRIAAAKHLTTADRARLTNEVEREQAGLTSLKSKIAADADLATLRTDLHAIVVDYRVYVLVVPQVRLTTAADTILAVTDRFAILDARLTRRLAAARSGGTDVGPLEAKLHEAEATVARVKEQVMRVPDQLGALTPAGYPGNRSVLLATRQTLREGRAGLRSARDGIREVIAGLRPVGDATTTTS